MKLTTIKSIAAAALCAVGLSAFAAEPEAVQLWEGGPYFATCNVGAEKPEDYGILTNFNDAAKAATDAMGAGWRVPSDGELKMLAGKNDGDKVCSNVWTTCNGVAGRRFFGMTSGYEDKSIFLPAAGYVDGDDRALAGEEGNYWSSGAIDDGHNALILYFYETNAYMQNYRRSYGFSVRAVKDPPPSVKVDKVESAEPWDSKTGKITVNYTLGGVDAATKYKVAFDITAGGEIASVTNGAAKLTNGATNTVINTATIFGKQVADPQAKVKVSLIAIKPKEIPAVQLWAGGPFWAEANLGTPESHSPAYPAEYGELYKFDDAAKAVTDALGGDWRVPTEDEWKALLTNCGKGTLTEQNGVKGRLFTGTGDYESNSIFLPAAGCDEGDGRKDAGGNGNGYYWSSTETETDVSRARRLYSFDDGAGVGSDSRSDGMSVRAVRKAE